jgi:hypothetical protein
MILEIAAPDNTRGAVGVFSMTACGEHSVIVYPRGIDAAKNYRITLDNTQTTFEMPGCDLHQNGIRISIPAALTSELILFENVE